jgi:hypothetical protein
MQFMGLFSAAMTLSIQVPTIGAVGGFLAITAVITGGIYLFKYFLNKKTEQLLQQKKDLSKQSSTLRKYDQVGIFQYTGTIYTGGFATALLICFLAINWTTSETEKVEEKADVDLTQNEVELEVQNTPPTPPNTPPYAPETPLQNNSNKNVATILEVPEKTEEKTEENKGENKEPPNESGEKKKINITT